MRETEVTSGTRKGCTRSPQLFMMVVNVIINNVLDSGMSPRDEEFHVPALLYADGELLLARSCTEAGDMIGVVVGVAQRCGLNINKGKSNV